MKFDEFLIEKGIENARKKAWGYALSLAYLEDLKFEKEVVRIDSEVALLSTKVLEFPKILSQVKWIHTSTQKNQIFAIPRLLHSR